MPQLGLQVLLVSWVFCLLYILDFVFFQRSTLDGEDGWAKLKILQKTTISGFLFRLTTYLFPVTTLLTGLCLLGII